MANRMVLLMCLFATSALSQDDKGSKSSDIMANIFAWANAVRPMDPVGSQSASVAGNGLPPDPTLPDPGLPLVPDLPIKDTVPRQGSMPAGQLPPPVVSKGPAQPANQDRIGMVLPTDIFIKGPLPGSEPDQGLQNQGSRLSVLPEPGKGPVGDIPPGNINLDADIIDPNLLFPAETAPAEAGGVKPVVDPIIPPKVLTDKPLSLPNSVPAEKIPNLMKPVVAGKPVLPTGPVEAILPVAPEFPFPLDNAPVPVDPSLSLDTAGRPISMVPIDTVNPGNRPEQPIPVVAQPANPALTDMKMLGDIGLGLASGGQNDLLSKWLEIHPNGRPDKFNNVKAEVPHDIAPPTPDQAMLSTLSLINFGKDRALRAMLREQRKQARQDFRLQMRQNKDAAKLSQGNAGIPANGNRGQGSIGNMGRGLAIGRGKSKLRRIKRQAAWKDRTFPKGKGKQLKMKGQMKNGKQIGRGPMFDGMLETGTVSEGQLSDQLTVTEQINQEAAKHISDPGLPKLKKQKGNQNTMKGLNKRQNKKGKKAKNFAKIPKEGIQVSDGTIADLTVMEQIQHEASKHVGSLAFPKKKAKKLKQLQKQSKMGRFPKEGVQRLDGSRADPSVTEQIQQEAAKQVGKLAFPKKPKAKRKQLPKRQNPGNQDNISNIKKQGAILDPGVDLPNLKGRKRNKKGPEKAGGKKKTFIQKMRSGKKPKVRPVKNFIDVSLSDSVASGETSLLDSTDTIQAPHPLTDTGSTPQIQHVPGLGVIDWTGHFDEIKPL